MWKKVYCMRVFYWHILYIYIYIRTIYIYIYTNFKLSLCIFHCACLPPLRFKEKGEDALRFREREMSLPHNALYLLTSNESRWELVYCLRKKTRFALSNVFYFLRVIALEKPTDDTRDWANGFTCYWMMIRVSKLMETVSCICYRYNSG